jgi:type II secretory pathway pseudopilin PulG
MSLLELTIVLSTLLVLITVIFVGARAWKRGTDRASCVLVLRNVQMATRSYQSLYGYNEGGRPYAENGSQDIARQLYAKGYIEEKLYHQAIGTEPCPGGGTYKSPAPDVFPVAGQLYLSCSLSAPHGHEPSVHEDW